VVVLDVDSHEMLQPDLIWVFAIVWEPASNTPTLRNVLLLNEIMFTLLP
jgi:hypothetical protein